jgi:small-conductance mechanosensitive channel
VEVAGIAGQVEHIRAQHGDSHQRQHHDDCANTKFIDSPVTNWTYTDRRVRFHIPVGVAYGSDIAKVHDLLLAVGRENPTRYKNPPERFS